MSTESLETRSRIMRAVKSENTTPEKIIRRLLTNWGYRYRLNRKDLPGKPDIVLSRLRKVIFVHGCFWHGHHCKRGNRTPKNNQAYWEEKIKKNKLRDRQNNQALRQENWKVFIVWECELKNNKTHSRIKKFLEN